jgi:hypothetical protein
VGEATSISPVLPAGLDTSSNIWGSFSVDMLGSDQQRSAGGREERR